MPRPTHWNIRRTDRRKEALVREIAKRIGADEGKFAAAVDLALAFTVALADKLDTETLTALACSGEGDQATVRPENP